MGDGNKYRGSDYNWLTINGVELGVRSAHRLRSFNGIYAVLMIGKRDTRIPVDFATDEKKAEQIVKKLNALGEGDYEYSRETTPRCGSKAVPTPGASNG